MEIRIKEHMSNNKIGYYVQVKRFLFWRNVSWHRILDDAKRDVEHLKDLDAFNSSQSSNKMVFDGWAVRNVGEYGSFNSFGFFHGVKPQKETDGSKSHWVNSDGYYRPLIEVKTEKLFGPHTIAAESTAGATLPCLFTGVQSTISLQPATFAGMASISTVEKRGAVPPGT